MKIYYNVCVDDYDGRKYRQVDGVSKPFMFFQHWINMIERCYSPSAHKKNPTYKNCEVCDEWKSLTEFKKWFDVNYVEGWQLDKDLMLDGNKVYCPEYARFVPNQLNQLLVVIPPRKYNLPTGVTIHKRSGLYMAQMKKNNKQFHIGYFKSENEAAIAYMKEKRAHSIEVLNSFYGIVSDEVYNKIKDKIERMFPV